MIRYRQSSVTIAEIHFDEAATPPAADVVRYQWRSEPVPGTYSFPTVSRFVDLTPDPDRLLGEMGKNNRWKIRRGSKDPIAAEFFRHPSRAVTDEFFRFYDSFAQAKKIPRANRARLLAMRERESLVLTRVNAEPSRALAWHCYLRHSTWARLIYSASVRLEDQSNPDSALIGRANRYLHFRDMMFLRELGVDTYDFGGWYSSQESAERLRINEFKEEFGGRVVERFTTYDGVTLKGAAAVQLQRARRILRGGA